MDSLKLPLKSYSDLLIAFNHMLANGLEDYLNHFIAPFPGDWPMQFVMRQLVYNTISVSLPDSCKNVVPLIGPLNISVNSGECVLLNFYKETKTVYWTLVRDTILSAFPKCEDIEFLTLLNLVDNYVPLVLSIYSVVFKCRNYDLYCPSLFRC